MTRKIRSEPRYQHDCDSCKFLGSYTRKGTKEDFDLYLCPVSIGGPTLLARRSSKGSDYTSSPAVAWERPLKEGITDGTVFPNTLLAPTHPYLTEHPLTHARTRAMEKGLYSP